MPRTIPLIRAANVFPLVGWLEKNRFVSSDYLEAADLAYWFMLSPLDPIPTVNAIQLLGNMARDHGPDVGARIVGDASLIELGYIGAVALGARTPIEALQRIQLAIPMHSSHESIEVTSESNSVSVVEVLKFDVEPAELHAVHVLFSSLIEQLCRSTGMHQPLLAKIEMRAHPDYGTAYLEDRFGCRVEASDEALIRISIKSSVSNNPFRTIARDRLPQMATRKIPPLTEDHSLSASVRSVISSMLHGGEPTVERVARAAGMSVRSFQRRLNDEDTSFSKELDRVRAQLALEHLGASNVSLSELSERLGYSAQSALSRAVRRLTGQTPSQLGNLNLR